MVFKQTLLENDKSFFILKLNGPFFKQGKWTIELRYGKKNTRGASSIENFKSKISASSRFNQLVRAKTTHRDYKIIRETQNTIEKQSLTQSELVSKLKLALNEKHHLK